MGKEIIKISLDKELEQYKTLLSQSVVTSSEPESNTSWLAYSAVVSSVLAMSATVDAAVIYSGVQNITLPSGNNDSVSIDINGDAIDDLTFFTFNSNTSGGYGYAGVLAGGNGVAINGLGLIADKLDYGEIIDNRMLFVENGNEALLRSVDGSGSVNPLMEWGATSTGIMGAKINVGANSYFTWIRVALTAGTSGYPDDFLIVDWAYDDTGAPILAGSALEYTPPPPSPSAVPLPGSLGLLAMGISGLAAFRRRKESRKE